MFVRDGLNRQENKEKRKDVVLKNIKEFSFVIWLNTSCLIGLNDIDNE